jgi:sugar lactone lactonase YvrE
VKIRLTHSTLAPVAALVAVAVAVSLFLLWRRGPARQPEAVRWPTVVSTLAGVGAPGLAEGRGREVAFADPFGIAVDAAGNTYVADAGDNNVIWRIDADGLARVVAGAREGFADGDGPSAAFNTPSGLAVDAAGNLLVADTGNHAIRRVTPAGSVTTVAGNGEPGNADGRGREARFNGPIGVAVGPDGSIVVADTYNDCIRLIAPDGQVKTTAGGGATGYRDGAAAQALFDTPSGVAVDAAGVIYVADTGNDAIRRIGRDGQVTTIGTPGSVGAPSQRVELFRPVGIAIGCPSSEPAQAGLEPCSTIGGKTSESKDQGPAVFVTDGTGRVLALPAAGELTTLAGTPAGAASASPTRAEPAVRFLNPTGIAVASDGSLRVADSDNYMVRRLTRPGDRVPSADVDFTPVPWLTTATLRISTFPWPLDPQREWHELAATLGEARGSPGGDGRERLHSGIDVRGPVGTIVRAVLEEKVERPIGATGFDSANEALRVGVVSYVHVRVGRTAGETILDPARFAIVNDDLGEPARIRVRRGTRFRVGDAIGTVNNLAHVHLDVGPRGGEINPLSLPLEPFHDHIAPTIAPRGIALYSEAGDRIVPPRKGPVPVSGRVAIVVDAYDRVDGNGARRKLGVYKLGYQALREDGTPAPGFDEPRMTIEFDRLPADVDAPRLIYADGSGITAYGSRTTRFRYIVTNSLHEGRVTQGLWDTSQLPAGDYRLRVIAGDWSGNETTRDLPVRVR